jgi:hypothetical protein
MTEAKEHMMRTLQLHRPDNPIEVIVIQLKIAVSVTRSRPAILG